MKALLGNASARFGIANLGEAHKRFLAKGRPILWNLLDAAVLYDRVYIPTNDFLCLPVLLGIFGEFAMAELLDEGVLGFARYKGNVGYLGNGGGISLLQIASEDGTPKLFSAPNDVAIQTVLSALQMSFDQKSIAKKALLATIDVDVVTDEIRKQVSAEAHSLGQLLPRLATADINRLPGIGENQIRMFSDFPDTDMDDAIEDTLKLSQLVIDARVAATVGSTDIFTSQRLYEVLRLKIDQNISAHAGTAPPTETLKRIQEIEGIPNFAEVALRDPRTLLRLIRLSRSEDAKQFRQWFHENCREDATRAFQSYAELMKHVPAVSSPIGKRVRFAIDIGLGVVTTFLNPALGLGIGTAATIIGQLVVERVFRGQHPKFFIEDLGKLTKGKKKARRT